MSKPWGVGAWAEEAEREEAEEKERAVAAAAAPMDAFPTLGEAASVKPKKKKQQQTFSLAELTIGRSVAPGSRSRSMSDSMSDSRGLTTNEMMMLPTGPRERSSEEEHRGGLGGAFRDYRDYNRGDRDQDRGGGGGLNRDRERDRDEPSRADDSSDWSSLKKPGISGGFEADRRGSRPPTADRDPPSFSRADEVDNWGLSKKSLPLGSVDARRRDTFHDSKQQSRADEIDNWASSKRNLPPPLPRGQDTAHSRANEVDNWASSKKIPSTEMQTYTGQDPHMKESGADFGGRWGKRSDQYQSQATEESQRRRLVIAPRSHQSSHPPSEAGSETVNSMETAPPGLPTYKGNPFGSARPREDVLASRVQDLQGSKTEFGAREQDSRPSSSHSIRPDTPEALAVLTARTRPKINPFGEAKPREVLLQERGKDWRKMDSEYEHRGVDRPETEDETLLMEEIKALKELIDKQREAAGAQQINGVVTTDAPTTHTQCTTELHVLIEELAIKEKQLEDLMRALDDQVRFSQKIGDRPGSRPGSRSGRSDAGRSYDSRPGSRPGSRPASRSGRSDVGRNYDLLERPGSQSGRRNIDSSGSPQSQSGYRGGAQWSGTGQFEGNKEALERMSWAAGPNERGRSFASLQRPRQHGGNVRTEVGGDIQEINHVDVWTRSNEPSQDGRGSWAGRERANDRARYHRF